MYAHMHTPTHFHEMIHAVVGYMVMFWTEYQEFFFSFFFLFSRALLHSNFDIRTIAGSLLKSHQSTRVQDLHAKNHFDMQNKAKTLHRDLAV